MATHTVGTFHHEAAVAQGSARQHNGNHYGDNVYHCYYDRERARPALEAPFPDDRSRGPYPRHMRPASPPIPYDSAYLDMSGVDIVRLVMGAFPFITSALDHYEASRKFTSDWWTMKRTHRKHLGKVKDCHLKFRLHLKELLWPLVLDGTIQEGEQETLLADPMGRGWSIESVEELLGERLAESHERYLEILRDMVECLSGLSQECSAEDPAFQTGLREPQGPFKHSAAHAHLMLEFEAKRMRYHLDGVKREDLLADIESCNTRLQDVLAANDRMSSSIRAGAQVKTRRVSSKALTFWKHASSVFRLMDQAWHCKCRSSVNLWLKHNGLSFGFDQVGIKMQLKLCRGSHTVHVRASTEPPVLRLGGGRPARHAKRAALVAQKQSSICGLEMKTKRLSVATHGDAAFIDSSLCGSSSNIHSVNLSGACIGTLEDDENQYPVHVLKEEIYDRNNTTLADVLRPGNLVRLNRVQRYGIALVLASTQLQLHSTPWLKDTWLCEDVQFSTMDDKLSAADPSVLVKFSQPQPISSKSTRDRSFSTLGIVLLELCFGRRLDDHELWSQPAFAPGKSDPMIRKTVACEWLEDVEGEAGDDYASAVYWTLHQAPAVVKDDRWRREFAENVVQPLERYCEYLNPKKTFS